MRRKLGENLRYNLCFFLTTYDVLENLLYYFFKLIE